jgi:hypothetical protein
MCLPISISNWCSAAFAWTGDEATCLVINMRRQHGEIACFVANCRSAVFPIASYTRLGPYVQVLEHACSCALVAANLRQMLAF